MLVARNRPVLRNTPVTYENTKFHGDAMSDQPNDIPGNTNTLCCESRKSDQSPIAQLIPATDGLLPSVTKRNRGDSSSQAASAGPESGFDNFESAGASHPSREALSGLARQIQICFVEPMRALPFLLWMGNPCFPLRAVCFVSPASLFAPSGSVFVSADLLFEIVESVLTSRKPVLAQADSIDTPPDSIGAMPESLIAPSDQICATSQSLLTDQKPIQPGAESL